MSAGICLHQLVFCGTCLLWCIHGQLIVNVRNKGGDVYRENIEANTTDDTITVEFQKADGTLVTQFIDFRNEVQIFKVVILPEEERGQTQVQTMCLVTRFIKSEFISSDAMSKLRQKNPSAVRHPEEVRPDEVLPLDLALNVVASEVISVHIPRLCVDAKDHTYMRDADLRLLSQVLNRDYSLLQTVARRLAVELPDGSALMPCSSAVTHQSVSLPCQCRYDVCVGWYPCGLKYCRGKDSAGLVVSYRCGIKTCGKCRRFDFPTLPTACIWDDADFTLIDEPTTPSVEWSDVDLYDREVEDPYKNGADAPGAFYAEAAPNNNSVGNLDNVAPDVLVGLQRPEGGVKVVELVKDGVQRNGVMKMERLSDRGNAAEFGNILDGGDSKDNAPDDDEDGE